MVVNVTQYPILQQMVINPEPFLLSYAEEVVEEPFSPFIVPVAFLIGLYYGWFIVSLVLLEWHGLVPFDGRNAQSAKERVRNNNWGS